MTQAQLKNDLTFACNNGQKLTAVKLIMDYLNQKERRIGLKEAKELADKHWGSSVTLSTNVTALLKDIRNYG